MKVNKTKEQAELIYLILPDPKDEALKLQAFIFTAFWVGVFFGLSLRTDRD